MFHKHFPTLDRLLGKISQTCGKKRPRTLEDRADELTNLLGKFLPRAIAVAITARILRRDRSFDLLSPENELIRYLLKQAIQDFQDKVAWLRDNVGDLVAAKWINAVREGRELFFPPYLQGCLNFGEEDGRGSGR